MHFIHDGTKPYLLFLNEDPTKNIYQVSHQTTVVGKYTNRYDVTLLVNGLPLVQIDGLLQEMLLKNL